MQTVTQDLTDTEELTQEQALFLLQKMGDEVDAARARIAAYQANTERLARESASLREEIIALKEQTAKAEQEAEMRLTRLENWGD